VRLTNFFNKFTCSQLCIAEVGEAADREGDVPVRVPHQDGANDSRFFYVNAGGMQLVLGEV